MVSSASENAGYAEAVTFDALVREAQRTGGDLTELQAGELVEQTLASGRSGEMPPKTVPTGFRVGGCVSTQQRTRLVFGSRAMSAGGARCSWS